MSALAFAAAMTTPLVYPYHEATQAGAITSKEQFTGDVIIVTPWVILPVKGVIGLEHLPRNWDGYGSPPVGRETANLAIAFIRQIAGLGIDVLPIPHVGPIVGGGVALEWAVGNRQVTLSVFPDATAEFVKADLGEPFEEGVITPRMSGQLHTLVSWLMGAPA